MASLISSEKQSKPLCKYFQQGVCQYGDSCMYSHNWSDKPSNVCLYYQRGCCSYGKNCRYDHVRDGSQNKVDLKPFNAPAKNGSESSRQAQVSEIPPRFQKRQTGLMSTSDSNGGCRQSMPVVQLTRGLDGKVHSNMVSLKKSDGEVLDCDSDKSSSLSLSDEQWVTASEFVPGQLWQGLRLPSTYSAAAHVGVPLPQQQLLTFPQSSSTQEIIELCPYFAAGKCPYGDQCQYIHGDICELCHLGVLSPFDEAQRDKHHSECVKQHEKDMELAFAVDRSKDKVCGICMETIFEKNPETARRFGILSHCCHVYCLDCIRKWRGAKQFENVVIRACPECRVKSDFVTPSKFWVEDVEEKEKLITEYKQSMSKKPCRYFDEGRGECPFYDKCFYRHAYPDGRLASPKAVRRRYRQNADGETSVTGRVLLWDFLEEHEESRRQRRVDDASADDEQNAAFLAQLERLGILLPSDSEIDVEFDELHMQPSDFESNEDQE